MSLALLQAKVAAAALRLVESGRRETTGDWSGGTSWQSLRVDVRPLVGMGLGYLVVGVVAGHARLRALRIVP